MEHDMDSVLISVVVTAIFIVLAATVGNRLGHTAKPYGIVKLAAHIILFLLVSGGVIASIYKLQGVAPPLLGEEGTTATPGAGG
jgi:hypothetical protein